MEVQFAGVLRLHPGDDVADTDSPHIGDGVEMGFRLRQRFGVLYQNELPISTVLPVLRQNGVSGGRAAGEEV